jgi:hypothetical protein
MKINNSSTLALAVSLTMSIGTAFAADNDQSSVGEGVGQLDITMQVLDENNSEAMSQLELPDFSKEHEQDSAADDPDGDNTGDNSSGDNSSHVAGEHPDNHGKIVSELAQDLKSAHDSAESGRAFAEAVHNTLVGVASDNAAAHSDAADAAKADAAAAAAAAKDNAAKKAAEAAKNNAADAGNL